MSEITNRQILDALEDPVIVVGESSRIRRGNDAAHRALPGLADAVGKPLEATFPDLAAAFGGAGEAGADESDSGDRDGGLPEVVTVDGGSGPRYFVPNATPLTVGPRQVGWALVLRDVTALERGRRELARQNERMDDFAAAIAHELRNTLAVVEGNLTLVGEAIADGEAARAAGAVESAVDAAERMTAVVDDLRTVARFSRPVEHTERLSFGRAVESAWSRLGVDEVALEVAADGSLAADPARFERIVGTVGRLAAGTGASTLQAGIVPGGFAFLTDGDAIAADAVDRAMEYGTAVPNAETGMLLPTVATLVRSHGWTVAVDADYDHGIRLAVEGVDTTRSDDAAGGA